MYRHEEDSNSSRIDVLEEEDDGFEYRRGLLGLYSLYPSPFISLLFSSLHSVQALANTKTTYHISPCQQPDASRVRAGSSVQRWCFLKLIYQARGSQGPICDLIACSCDSHRLHKEQSSSYRRELAGQLKSWQSSSYYYTPPLALCFNPLSTPDLPLSLSLGGGCLMLTKRQAL